MNLPKIPELTNPLGAGLLCAKKARYKIAPTFQVKVIFAVNGGTSHIPRSDFYAFKP